MAEKHLISRCTDQLATFYYLIATLFSYLILLIEPFPEAISSVLFCCLALPPAVFCITEALTEHNTSLQQQQL